MIAVPDVVCALHNVEKTIRSAIEQLIINNIRGFIYLPLISSIKPILDMLIIKHVDGAQDRWMKYNRYAESVLFLGLWDYASSTILISSSVSP